MKNKKIQYFESISFSFEPSYEERESIIRRRIYQEQEKFKGKDLKWIVVEKDMKSAKIKFTRKSLKNEAKVRA